MLVLWLLALIIVPGLILHLVSSRGSSRVKLGTSAVITALYWIWEARTGGNIRVDLLFIYPVLFSTYVISARPRFGNWAFLIAAALVLVNLAYAAASYQLFDKYPG